MALGETAATGADRAGRRVRPGNALPEPWEAIPGASRRRTHPRCGWPDRPSLASPGGKAAIRSKSENSPLLTIRL